MQTDNTNVTPFLPRKKAILTTFVRIIHTLSWCNKFQKYFDFLFQLHLIAFK